MCSRRWAEREEDGVYLYSRRWAGREDECRVKEQEVLARKEEQENLDVQCRLHLHRERETSLGLEAEAEVEVKKEKERSHREVDRLKVDHERGVGRLVEIEGHRAEVGRLEGELGVRFLRVGKGDEISQARLGLEEHEKEITLLPSLGPKGHEKEKEEEKETETETRLRPLAQSLLVQPHLQQEQTEPTLQIQIQTLRLKHRKELREYKLVAQEWKERAELWEAQVNALVDGNGDVGVRVRGGAGRGRV